MRSILLVAGGLWLGIAVAALAQKTPPAPMVSNTPIVASKSTPLGQVALTNAPLLSGKAAPVLWFTPNVWANPAPIGTPGRTNTLKAPLVLLAKPGPGQPLAPGLYKTMPYSCLVLVPGGHTDDLALITPPSPAPPMPSIQPELQFIPWGPKAK